MEIEIQEKSSSCRKKVTGNIAGDLGIYFLTNRMPAVPGPQWQEMVQPAVLS